MMGELACIGGTPAVPESHRKFDHPLAIRSFDFASMKDLNIIDYNGGGIIDNLEIRFASWCGRKLAVAFNSGTSALAAMYFGVGLQRGDEVIVPAYTFFATATPLVQLGCIPILADCDEFGNIDPDSVEQLITPSVKAIVITHMWGMPCAMKRLCSIAASYDLLLLEDASHAHGATYEGQMVGSFGDAAAWSLGAKKLLTGGQGGIFACDERVIFERGILLGHYNRRGQRDVTLQELQPYAITGMGMNTRMHPCAAALINHHFDFLEIEIRQRAECVALLKERLRDVSFLEFPEVPSVAKPSWYACVGNFCAQKANGYSRDDFLKMLNAEGASEVDAPSSTRPISDFQLFKECSLNAARDGFDRAHFYHANLVKFPTWYGADRYRFVEHYSNAVTKVAGYMGQ